jgi:serine O-acetyltransferase
VKIWQILFAAEGAFADVPTRTPPSVGPIGTPETENAYRLSVDRGPLIEQLLRTRREVCFPPGFRREVEAWTEDVLGLLFPHFAQSRVCQEEEVRAEVDAIAVRLAQRMQDLATMLPMPDSEPTVDAFLDRLGNIRARLLEDAQAILDGDPAAQSLDEVILVYPGFRAIATHRLAHELYRLRVPLIPRIMSEYAHHRTGVDIHPGARIGRRFCIDHGTGVVIGETTEIGDDVKLYQGVTLGALSVAKSMAQTKRHPTLEDRVVVYAQATILGGETVVGRDSLIGGNVWLTESVPPMSVVTRPAEVRVRSSQRMDDILNWVI